MKNYSYEVSNFGAIAFLMAKKCELQGYKKAESEDFRLVFCFTDEQNRPDLLKDYYAGNEASKVVAKELTSAWGEIKSMILEERRKLNEKEKKNNGSDKKDSY